MILKNLSLATRSFISLFLFVIRPPAYIANTNVASEGETLIVSMDRSENSEYDMATIILYPIPCIIYHLSLDKVAFVLHKGRPCRPHLRQNPILGPSTPVNWQLRLRASLQVPLSIRCLRRWMIILVWRFTRWDIQ